MAYRILIEPAAARRLRTFLPHVVQRVARLLAEAAEPGSGSSMSPMFAVAVASGGEDVVHIDAEGVCVSCRRDGRNETLTLVDVEEREGAFAALPEAHVHASAT
jgi:hypothetical protein